MRGGLWVVNEADDLRLSSANSAQPRAPMTVHRSFPTECGTFARSLAVNAFTAEKQAGLPYLGICSPHRSLLKEICW